MQQYLCISVSFSIFFSILYYTSFKYIANYLHDVLVISQALNILIVEVIRM